MSLVELTDASADTSPGVSASDLEPIWITASEVNLNGVWNDTPGERALQGALFQTGHPLQAYWPIAPIGSGSHGEVWKAVRVAPSLKLVALKVLRQEQSYRADRRARFRREAEIAMRLDDPAILPVEDFGEVDGVLYIVMPLVEGATLAGVIAERQQWSDADGSTAGTAQRRGSWWSELSHEDYTVSIVRALARVARGLACTHAQKLVHRDVKPANILLDGADEERVFLSDFGLGRHLDDPAPQSGDGSGTPLYMAPEKLLGQEVDEVRCDIYGLGATLYEALTLVRPLPVPEGLHRSCLPTYLAGLEPARPRTIRPDCPAVVEAIILKAMHRDPSLRYHSAAALADDLDGCVEFLGIAANNFGENVWAAGSRRLRGDVGQPWGNPHARQSAYSPTSTKLVP
jgi:serine/threonine-protein kinase